MTVLSKLLDILIEEWCIEEVILASENQVSQPGTVK